MMKLRGSKSMSVMVQIMVTVLRGGRTAEVVAHLMAAIALLPTGTAQALWSPGDNQSASPGDNSKSKDDDVTPYVTASLIIFIKALIKNQIP
jgi:hypothetical protein